MTDKFKAAINTIRTTLLRAQGRKKLVLFFIPSDRLKPHDAVDVLRPEIIRRLGNRVKSAYLDVSPAHVSEIISNTGGGNLPERIMILAHPKVSFTGFAVNWSRSNPRGVLLPFWWSHSEHKYGLLIAHVCWGANILGRNAWRDVFPEWVSYSDEVIAFFGTPLGVKRWADLCTNLIHIAEETNNAASAVVQVRAAYQDGIEQIFKTMNAEGGDALNLMYFQRMLRYIDSSED